MALAFAIIYILVVGLGILSSYQDGIFNEFVEEVHNMGIQAKTDDEDWDSDEDDDDDDDDDEPDDDGHSSGAVSHQTGNPDKAISTMQIQLEPKVQR
ncbi:hypothetical protein FNAPI_1467 [Fusarium napiforme]|uniref:Uncharacterized protein n=1 Tax=Fusarium napiforme TaxID=42672 RepID=A0A8H5K2Z4_9HYPO|nr:hypothetical protein FNAPI_1467 [Fusarium napiforme]